MNSERAFDFNTIQTNLISCKHVVDITRQCVGKDDEIHPHPSMCKYITLKQLCLSYNFKHHFYIACASVFQNASGKNVSYEPGY